MNIEKSLWSSHGDNITLSVPFTKVNREKRTVSGFATLDNVDQTGDVVTSEASIKAFENFRGNLREMHQPVAVGKIVSFKPIKSILYTFNFIVIRCTCSVSCT